ncbi:CBS domain-containing protein [uncultured Agathobaculum sp.]|uniref:CBS domain-containing protein n=1 Tax=uncultured Agathobaculum sp. TaxID=2048140 RepID=UPI00296E6DF4
MNIFFFLKPKVEVSYLTESCPVQQAMQDMLRSGFTAIPVVNAKGTYVGTITEGDFLRLVLHYPREKLEQLTVGQVELRVHHRSVSIDAKLEDMVERVTEQNFVPVVDGRGMFCGIVTRRDVITYLCEQVKQ